MVKNRKTEAAEIWFAPVLKVLLLCGLICGSALGYVWQKSQIHRLGAEITKREMALNRLKNDNKFLADQIAILHSPVMLDRQVRQLNLGLAPAQPLQVVRLAEPPPPPPDVSRQFAGRPASGESP